MRAASTQLNRVLEGLMQRYQNRVPDVQGIINAMIREQLIGSADDIENDHIAFRTLGVPHLGIQSLEKIFIQLGYVKKDYYFFPEKKLDAFWYAPPEPTLPRIFISELRVQELSEKSKQIIHSYTSTIITDPVDQLNLADASVIDAFLHSGLWELPSASDYKALLEESEYAAWVIYNRYYLNHFTVSVHHLKAGYNTIPAFNEFLERNGFILNDAGGKVKISPDGLLLQSSTIARMIKAVFAGGEELEIPGSYVEFAERKPLPEYSGLPIGMLTGIHRREGFEAANANRIFESTYRTQTNR
ncbi:DUF1338 domain-containing protein [Flavihumibacter sp. CACIAM 22H1]|uniref:DUF1338 domain-containing protein n=1 Tax=Flavihumibacter sp. CACIAM 22H1 TaxID=1812911 RepID=UPI0007A7CC86|nr:DUF1338 domain-containing protein [Flavihumibacter sp. CACIAM 22H1]KYP16005.1 MAG: DUF1338 domain-containing protein [Flavihumibacter sp. CACIAM 22H1]